MAGRLPPATGRQLVAIAGPPASGKSTVAAALAEDLPDAVHVPMDGFHLDDRVLRARGLLARKGAPETFDLAGFAVAVARLKAGGEVILPVFDRTREIAIAGALVVPAEARRVVIEGNYLLYDRPGWRELAGQWDFSVAFDLPEPVLRARLEARWRRHGLDPEAMRAKIEGNDMPNARAIAAHRLPADMTLSG